MRSRSCSNATIATLTPRVLLDLVVAATLVVSTTGCGAKLYKHDLLADPESGNAEVYIFRTSGFVGAIGRSQVLLDGAPLLKLNSGSYAKAYIVPGIHKLEIEDATAVQEFLAGRTYFFLIQAPSLADYTTQNTTKFDVSVVDQKDAEELMRDLKPVDEIAASPQKNRSTMDRSASLLDRARWVVQDLENAERGFGYSNPNSNEVKAICQSLEEHVEANPQEAEACILLARLTRVRVASQPVITRGGELQSGSTEIDQLLEATEVAVATALENDASNPELLYRQARLYGLQMPAVDNARVAYHHRDLEAALRSAQKAVDLDPDNVEYVEALTFFLVAEDRWEDALRVTASMSGGQHPLYLLLRDMQEVPVPEGAVYSAVDSRSLAEQQVSRGRFLHYPEMRVRFYVLPMSAEDIAATYVERWPDFKLFELDKVEPDDGGEMRFLGQFLSLKGDVLQPTSKKSVVKKAQEKDGIALSITECRGVPSMQETPAGAPVPVGQEVFSFLVMIHYGHNAIVANR